MSAPETLQQDGEDDERDHVGPAERNQAGLVAELADVAARLRPGAGLPPVDTPPPTGIGVPGLDLVAESFGLTPFERSVLLLCAGPELDSGFGPLVAAASGDERRQQASFALALASLPDAHWTAINASAPLRRWRLVEPVEPAGGPLSVTTPVRVDEYVLHVLAGAGAPDPRLAGIAEPGGESVSLPATQAQTAQRVADLWDTEPSVGPQALLPVLVCSDRPTREEVAACAAAGRGLGLLVVEGDALPTSPAELALVARLVERTCVVEGRAVVIDVTPADGAADVEPAFRLADDLSVPVVMSMAEWPVGRRRPVVAVDVGHPTAAEQRRVWVSSLRDPDALAPGELDRVVGSFDLQPSTIRAAARLVSADDRDGHQGTSLWQACRRTSRARLGGLAQRLAPVAAYEDLVLPEDLRATLAEMAMQVRYRGQVFGDWQMRRDGRGLSTTALFSGPSGTGKTMAAEALAADLELDLFRVDLSAVVSKYIGETEKNLRRLFDAAEDAAAVLVFDEADALFGQRTEVKDSHDRYANVEVSYLLQRVESYRGVAILTTNFREALDKAFLRRIRFVLDFPFPDAVARQAIWERSFPSATPTDDLDFAALARLNLAGGGIRSVAVRAAFLAAADGAAVSMEHLRRAARAELAKLDLSFAGI